MGRIIVFWVAILHLSACAPSVIAADLPENQLKAICGQIASINAPDDVHAKAEIFGFAMHAPKTYPPGTSPTNYSLGVSRSNPNPLGIMAALSASYVSKSNAVVIYGDKDLVAHCVDIHREECPATLEIKCIDTPTTQK